MNSGSLFQNPFNANFILLNLTFSPYYSLPLTHNSIQCFSNKNTNKTKLSLILHKHHVILLILKRLRQWKVLQVKFEPRHMSALLPVELQTLVMSSLSPYGQIAVTSFLNYLNGDLQLDYSKGKGGLERGIGVVIFTHPPTPKSVQIALSFFLILSFSFVFVLQ